MSGEIKFTIFLWILLIIFIVGRNYYRKQQEKKLQTTLLPLEDQFHQELGKLLQIY